MADIKILVNGAVLALVVTLVSCTAVLAGEAPAICELNFSASGNNRLVQILPSAADVLGLFAENPTKETLAYSVYALNERFVRNDKGPVFSAVNEEMNNPPSVMRKGDRVGFVWSESNFLASQHKVVVRFFDLQSKRRDTRMVVARPKSFPYISQALPLSNGGFIVGWWAMPDKEPESFFQIFSSTFKPVGDPIRIPTKGNEVVYYAIPLAGGGFTIVWEADKNYLKFFWARQYAADGKPMGEPFKVPELEKWSGNYSLKVDPATVGLPPDKPADGVLCGRELEGQRYAAINVPNATTVWLQGKNGAYMSRSTVLATDCKMLGIGTPQVNKRYRLTARLWSETGTALSDAFLVSGDDLKHIRSTAVRALPRGRFLMTWEESRFEDYDLAGRVIDPANERGGCL